MSLIGWIIIAMIVVTAIAVIVNVWCSKLYREIWDYPFGLIAVELSLGTIAIGCMQLAFPHADGLEVNTVIVVITGAAAIVLVLVQLRACWQTHRWNESSGHG